MPNFFRRMVGSNSKANASQRNREDEEVEDEENPEFPSQRQENMQVILSEARARPDHYWWDDEPIKKYVTWSFTCNTGDEYFTRWGEASNAQRRKMWNYFATHVRSIDPEYDPIPEWQARVTRRITTLINGIKYNKKPPKWVPVSWLENLKNRPNDPTFAKHSKVNTANRKSGGKDGKALGTHTLGRKSCSDAFKELRR
ncbi:uncharacterized protein LOC141612545 [Silene latifolia]|uniref:uncharacterized protein LOC141612545 n=1 Tax=Silene latifolia TaxID=37657 RepID=UPI003D784C56